MQGQPPILNPTWSLAIEEQFYLAWPLAVLLCGSARRTGLVALLLVVSAPLFRVLYHLHGIDPYAMTFGRLDGLGCGAALAALSQRSPGRRGKAVLLGVCALGAVALLPLLHDLVLRKALKDTSTNLLFAAAVGTGFYWTRSKQTGLLRARVLRYFGTISYCAYLVHLPLIYRFGFPAGFVLTVSIATASFFLFEQPILRLKERFTRADPVV